VASSTPTYCKSKRRVAVTEHDECPYGSLSISRKTGNGIYLA
jgi:hypothetical protein